MREKCAGLRVWTRAHPFPGVVQEQRKIKHEWVFEFLEQSVICAHLRIGRCAQRIQFIDADQGVFIRGVAMEKFVLHQAGERPEFRDVLPEKIDPMHHAQNRTRASFAGKNAFENLARPGGITKGAIHLARMTCDEIFQFRTQV